MKRAPDVTLPFILRRIATHFKSLTLHEIHFSSSTPNQLSLLTRTPHNHVFTRLQVQHSYELRWMLGSDRAGPQET